MFQCCKENSLIIGIIFLPPLAAYWKSLQQSSALLSMSQAEAELRVREQETINNLQSVSLTTSRMDTKQYVVCV